MKNFDYYREKLADAPSDVVRERYIAEADHSGRFTAEQLDRLVRIAYPEFA